MSCRDVALFIGDYLAGELGAHERSIFEGHLTDCPECVAYLQSYAETVRLAKHAYVDDALTPVIPERLVRAILEART